MTDLKLTGTTAEEKQRYFEQLCALPDEVLQNLWENSEVRDRLQKISERLAVAHWEQFRDTIKCSKCGFGFFPNGACSGNPGPGGWCSILRYGDKEKIISGGEEQTTNNRMELCAVIYALQALKESCNVILTSDSKYIIDSISKGWVYSWQKNGWKKSDKSPALNVDLWEQLLPLLEKHKVEFIWIKGHAGHPENEKCDQIAVSECKKFK